MLGHSYHKVKLLIASPKELDNASESVILNVLIWMTGNQLNISIEYLFWLKVFPCRFEKEECHLKFKKRKISC